MSISGLNHIAYKCCDPQATRDFYEDLLGLPMVLTLQATIMPSTGEPEAEYFHFFFQMADGSCVAFFDLADDEMPLPSPNKPKWTNHLALEMDSVESLSQIRERLEAAGFDVVGELDHEFVTSIYLFDPNDVRLELTAKIPDGGYLERSLAQADSEFNRWMKIRKSIKPASAAPQG